MAALKKPSHEASDDDVLKAYMNRGGNAGSHKWNEHQYFVRAMDDLHRNQQDKMAKVSVDHHVEVHHLHCTVSVLDVSRERYPSKFRMNTFLSCNCICCVLYHMCVMYLMYHIKKQNIKIVAHCLNS